MNCFLQQFRKDKIHLAYESEFSFRLSKITVQKIKTTYYLYALVKLSSSCIPFPPHIGIHSNLSHTLPRIFMSRPINSFTSQPLFVPFTFFCTKNNKTNFTGGVRTKCKYEINGATSPALYSNCFEHTPARTLSISGLKSRVLKLPFLT